MVQDRVQCRDVYGDGVESCSVATENLLSNKQLFEKQYVRPPCCSVTLYYLHMLYRHDDIVHVVRDVISG
jgi:hypothetical protein